MKTQKRTISVLLILSMLLTNFPCTVFGEEQDQDSYEAELSDEEYDSLSLDNNDPYVTADEAIGEESDEDIELQEEENLENEDEINDGDYEIADNAVEEGEEESDVALNEEAVSESEEMGNVEKDQVPEDANIAFDASYANDGETNIEEGIFKGHKYAVFDIGGTYEDANQYCISNGGHLATITSQEENDFVYNYLKKSGYTNAYFGYTDREKEGTWKWINGEESSYTNWAAYEPNAERSAEDYAMFYWKYTTGKWNDGDFGVGTNAGGTTFICEWEPGSNSFPEISEEERNVIVYYKNGNAVKVKLDKNLESYLNKDATIYNPELSHLLILLATSAYHDPKVPFTRINELEGSEVFPENPLSITESLHNLGFSASQNNIEEYNYYLDAFSDKYPENTTAYSIATKQDSSGNNILTVVIRGSYGGFGENNKFNFDWHKWSSDWQSNIAFKNYDVGYHEGFKHAANEVYDNLLIFMSDRHIDVDTCKFIVTGHSRGAAVANLLSKKMIDAGIQKEKVYDYNFACPDTARDYDSSWNADNKYGNIFNINNVKDIIGVIPGALFSPATNYLTFFKNLFSEDKAKGVLFWGKYGTTYFFSNNWGSLEGTSLGKVQDEHDTTSYIKYLTDNINSSSESFKSWFEAREALVLNSINKLVYSKLVGVFCPVNITVWDSSGNKVAEVIDGKQLYYGDTFGSVVIVTSGDQNLIYLNNSDEYRIELTATDNGKLTYVATDLLKDSDDNYIRYDNVDLVPNKIMSSDIKQNESASDIGLIVLDDQNNPIKNVSIDGVETAINAEDENNEGNTDSESDPKKERSSRINTSTKQPSASNDKKKTKTKKVNPSISLSKTKYVYNGKAKQPKVTVKVNGKKLASKYYKVSYGKGRKKPGKYRVLVTLKNGYAGKKSAYFTIIPKSTSIKSIKGKKRGFRIKWRKNIKQISGFQIQFSRNKKFKKAKNLIIKKSKSKTTIKNLKRKKKYYVRIRTFKKIKNKTYYSSWSKVKRVKTK